MTILRSCYSFRSFQHTGSAMKSLWRVMIISFFSYGLVACSILEPMFKTEKVEPWQKGILAKKEMSLEGDRIDGYVDEHIYFSKEASTGGTGVGGGGCGCN